MDIIEQARELGRQIQKDDRYLKVQIAQQNSDNDKELQALIGEFNLKRMNINTEAQKEDRSEEKLQKLNQELKEKGYLTISGRVNRKYFQEKACYGGLERKDS